MDQFLFSLFIVALVVFLVLRGFWCWYWKINDIVSLLKSQNKLLLQILRDGVGSGDSVQVEVRPILKAPQKGGLFSIFSKKKGGEGLT